MATQSRRQNDGNLLLESTLRGAAGDPFGVALEQQGWRRQLVQRAEAVRQSCITTRAVLTSRYGIEFPVW